MSIIIIAFPAAPKVDPEAQRKDEELNKLLKQKVEGKPGPNPMNSSQACKYKSLVKSIVERPIVLRSGIH